MWIFSFRRHSLYNTSSSFRCYNVTWRVNRLHKNFLNVPEWKQPPASFARLTRAVNLSCEARAQLCTLGMIMNMCEVSLSSVSKTLFVLVNYFGLTKYRFSLSETRTLTNGVQKNSLKVYVFTRCESVSICWCGLESTIYIKLLARLTNELLYL